MAEAADLPPSDAPAAPVPQHQDMNDNAQVRQNVLNQGVYDATIEERPAVLGRVLGLLGFAFAFTAVGAYIGQSLGDGAFWISLVGSFATLFTLIVVREKSPLNLILMYAFATFEGLLLGQVIEQYIATGAGAAVVDAAITTAVITIAAGAYGYMTRRDLTGLGGVLTIALLGVIVASVIGLFVQLPALYIGISIVAALLFTAFVVYDLNRVANSRGATDGDVILLTISVYLDILNLFLALLRLFGAASDKNDN
jgi:modulator of FtsH protease